LARIPLAFGTQAVLPTLAMTTQEMLESSSILADALMVRQVTPKKNS